jgi:isopenicillin N synthase-like dioxygenase
VFSGVKGGSVVNGLRTLGTLPVLDLSRFGAEATHQGDFLADLRSAAREVGFFYVTGHGVPAALNAAVLDCARSLFALPEEQKLAIEMVNSPHFRGYNRAGFEHTRGRPDWREQIDIGAEEPPVPLDDGAPAYLRLKGPNQWPATLPDFKPVVLEWQEQVTALLVRLLRASALALEQGPDVFAPIYDGSPHQLLKLIRYPGRPQEDAEQGVGAHKDSGLLSLILQDGHGGLQVEAPDGRWIDAAPRHDAFVVNIGELLELASDGYLKAAVHRVVSPPAGAERCSAAFFLGARLDATVPALQLPPHLAAEAPGFARDPLNPLFHQVGQNTLKSRLRSHPDVAARHHADLLTQSS